MLFNCASYCLPVSSSKFSSSSSSLNHVNNNRPMTSSADEDDNSQHSKHIAGYLSRSSPLAVHVDKKLAFVVDVSGTKILGLQIDGKSHCSIEVGTKIGQYRPFHSFWPFLTTLHCPFYKNVSSKTVALE